MTRAQAMQRSVFAQLAGTILFLCTISRCGPIKLVGDYDEQIDKWVTALQKDTEVFLAKLESVDGAQVAPYEPNKAFYGEAKVAISSIRLRADAMERNSITVQMLDRLLNNLNRFERDHKQGISKEELPLYRGGFNSQFTAILTFELAKKRGEKPDEAKAKAATTPIVSEEGGKK